MITLYNGNETNFTHNGLGILKDCISAVVQREINGKFELNVSCKLSEMTSNIVVGSILKAKTLNNYQLFRVVRTINNGTILKIYCQHVFYDLENSYITNLTLSGTAVQIMSYLINNMYSDVAFTVSGTATTVIAAFVTEKGMLLPQIMGEYPSLTKMAGCELDFNGFEIIVKNQIGEDNGVSIAYRKNLLGLIKTIDASSLATRVIPINADGAMYNDLYVDSGYINDYPIIYYDTVACNVVEDPDNPGSISDMLHDEAVSYLSSVEKPKISYTINFAQLEQTEEYKGVSDTFSKVNIGDTVKVVDARIGDDIYTRVVGYSFDCLTDKIIGTYLNSTPTRYVYPK